jgi:hypothetical protein
MGHYLPLTNILLCEQKESYVKSLECRCDLGSEARTKTGNKPLPI